MTVRTGRPSRLPRVSVNDPRLDRAQNISAAQEEQAQRHRLNTGMMKDGTEPMEAPLPLQTVVTADLPPAAEWEGSWIYNETTGKTLFSDGSAWVDHGALQTITLTGDVTGSGTASFATTIANDAVTFAKMQEIATQRLIGRNTASTGNPEEVTIEQALNWISGSANGDLMYRTAGNWTRLAIGAAGRTLTVNVGGTAPEWAAPPLFTLQNASIANGTTNVDVALSASYSMYEIELVGIQPVSAAVDLRMRFSQSGSFLSGASDYCFAVPGAADEAQDYMSSVVTHGENTNEYSAYTFRLYRPGASSFPKQLRWVNGGRTAAPGTFSTSGYGQLLANLDAIDGVRFYWSSGNWNTGHIFVRAYT